MAYITAITDRDAADIAAQNSKAFFNVADWGRIYGNSLATNLELFDSVGVVLRFDAIFSPTDESIPTINEINTFLENIERMRLWASTYPALPGLVEIKDDYEAGQNKTAPTFNEVNDWESVIDIIYQVYKPPYITERVPVTGISISGAGLTRNHGFR